MSSFAGIWEDVQNLATQAGADSLIKQAGTDPVGAMNKLIAESKQAAEIAGALLDPKQRTKIIERITIESGYTPPIVIDYPFAPSAAPDSVDTGAWATSIKPRITVKVRYIDRPMVAAPYGDPPNPNAWPYVKWGAILGGGFLAAVILRGLTRK